MEELTSLAGLIKKYLFELGNLIVITYVITNGKVLGIHISLSYFHSYYLAGFPKRTSTVDAHENDFQQFSILASLTTIEDVSFWLLSHGKKGVLA